MADFAVIYCAMIAAFAFTISYVSWYFADKLYKKQ